MCCPTCKSAQHQPWTTSSPSGLVSKSPGSPPGLFLTTMFYLQINVLSEWRDPDSNRGHHDFQLGKARSPLFLTAQKSAWITGSCITDAHHCSPLSKLGCRHSCRQLPEKIVLRHRVIAAKAEASFPSGSTSGSKMVTSILAASFDASNTLSISISSLRPRASG
jgi:hypothetical protein